MYASSLFGWHFLMGLKLETMMERGRPSAAKGSSREVSVSRAEVMATSKGAWPTIGRIAADVAVGRQSDTAANRRAVWAVMVSKDRIVVLEEVLRTVGGNSA
jgi:hypothetical protein